MSLKDFSEETILRVAAMSGDVTLGFSTCDFLERCREELGYQPSLEEANRVLSHYFDTPSTGPDSENHGWWVNPSTP
ncbi:hypothetical protein FCL40_09475 [Ferrimonas sediminicola]|uniref:Uncharacterized protein n=1 Tax=Ferrimonas sediminicola TaxID=2569538 RepID=A0A4U1BCX3_9GAMM|nr:hypothetical protein [Ferrimonas sediminicola]TKB48863.1 hypothetical protein FCL40_09475 [Ferrimonas sediminicola]